MRVTANTSSENSLFYIQQGRAKLDKLQELISSGQNVNRPSDDPISTNLILGVADKIKTGDQFKSNIDKTQILLQVTSTALQGMADTLKLAKDLASSLVNGSSDPETRSNAVNQLQALKQQMIDMGNTQFNDSYIFGGADNTTPPFAGASPYYFGDETALKVEIGNATTQQTNIPGNQLLTGSSALLPAPGVIPYGNTNIMQTIDQMIADVGANNAAGIATGATALLAGSKQIQNAQNDIVTRIVRLDGAEKMNTNNRNTLLTIVGNVQNVDYAKLGVELTQQQTAFNASLSATAKITQLSLLDYL
jgi:flagellar hook-associated protein 3 FlgL